MRFSTRFINQSRAEKSTPITKWARIDVACDVYTAAEFSQYLDEGMAIFRFDVTGKSIKEKNHFRAVSCRW